MFIRKPYIAAIHDILVAAISLVISIYLRLGDGFSESFPYLLPAAALFTLSCTVVFSFMGLYKGLWRYASLNDLVNIAKTAALATLIFIPLMFMFNRLEDFPRSVLVINLLVMTAMLGGPRILYRMIKDKEISFGFLDSKVDNRKNIMLVGVGENAISFLREAAKKLSSEYKVVAIIDDNKERIGRYIHGIKVYGDIDSIPKVIKRLKRRGCEPKHVVLGQSYLNNENINKLLKMADLFNFSLAKLPRMSDFKGDISHIEIKPIAIEDLLGRAQIPPSLGRREELIKDLCILVTGAGGTIGSELVRQIVQYRPSKLILLEISEFNLYQIDRELSESFSNTDTDTDTDTDIVSLIGDVKNKATLNKIFTNYKPHIVFHAAALKHVPIVENNIIEAFMTNVIGSKNVADMCLLHKARRMVMVSTDKAVNPTSLMGVTKRAAECYVQGLGCSYKNLNTVFSTVRFGNVLGSSGSVIPLFKSQLEQGKALTVTHPDMERFFMTVPEAVELILQASTLESHGQKANIFVLDMGKPIKIQDLATQMIKLAGLRPQIDVPIKYIGMRPGEKLYEELFYDNEEKKETLYKGVIQATARDLDLIDIVHRINAIQESCEIGDEENVLEQLFKIVPEYENKAVTKKNKKNVKAKSKKIKGLAKEKQVA